ncbi:MAG: hypothetical protein IPP91_06350 [Betaproteobacteria bacterium]|nr:hypothetical protein [Betaproteobacteria bacterium]
MKIATFPVALSMVLAGCSSVESISEPAAGVHDGLVYYMPRTDFLVTIVKAKEGITSVSLGTTAAYPDVSKSYVIRHSANLFGKNTLLVGVDVNGLLKSSKSTTTSGVTDAFSNLGSTLGTFQGLRSAQAAPKAVDTCAIGTHTFIFASPEEAKAPRPCGLAITITKLKDTSSTPPPRPVGEPLSGIFYRQAEPYLVQAAGPINTSAIVFSPNNSPTYFLPVSRTFFSNNEADFGFTDGMPTKYNQDTEGELIALLKLPATVLTAYFAAMGATFDSFKTRDAKEADALAASIKLEMAKKKYEACLAAILAKDDTAIAKLECGK